MIQDANRIHAFRSSLFPLIVLACCANTSIAEGLIRGKKPDRGTYTPPVLVEAEVQSVEQGDVNRQVVRRQQNELVAVPVELPDAPPVYADAIPSPASLPSPVVLADEDSIEQVVRTVSFEHDFRQDAHQPGVDHDVAPSSVQQCSCESCRAGVTGSVMHTPLNIASDPVFDMGCDTAPCCDGTGCDSPGCSSCGRWGLGLGSDDWFGSIELLLMFRSGDHLPALATDGPLDSTGANNPAIFAGRENVYKDMTAGGRLTLGAWLDNYKDRHLVARGWFAGEQTYGFTGDQNSHPTLVRPFFNVTDGVTPIDDVLVVATPNEASGQLSIQGDSNVYGADLSIRQLWYKRYGATVDLLYGYQYMGVDETLRISDRATSLTDVPPIGSIRATTDQFDVQNDFHGGQFGVASHYREGCWSFSSLAKIGFGSVRRRAVLSGSTFNSIDGNNAIDPNGLLVRSTNAGTFDDNTFGWVPELDLTLGWQRYPCFDVTFGYHLVAMTDALQVSGAIDPNLAVNSTIPPVGAQRPAANFRHGTFYVQGIHFGLSYVY